MEYCWWSSDIRTYCATGISCFCRDSGFPMHLVRMSGATGGIALPIVSPRVPLSYLILERRLLSCRNDTYQSSYRRGPPPALTLAQFAEQNVVQDAHRVLILVGKTGMHNPSLGNASRRIVHTPCSNTSRAPALGVNRDRPSVRHAHSTPGPMEEEPFAAPYLDIPAEL
jgi:hypothetical protein